VQKAVTKQGLVTGLTGFARVCAGKVNFFLFFEPEADAGEKQPYEPAVAPF
jgi:hypothetical protein